MQWIDVLSTSELIAARKRLVRIDGKQILVMQTDYGVTACPNRCPHEGYPLSEGDLTDQGMLRCNWHNWTFDLVSGKTVVGGDTLLQYPVKIENGRVFVSPEGPDLQNERERALTSIVTALDDADHARLLRETARLIAADGDPLGAIRTALQWLAPRLKYGTTHAIAGAADWIALSRFATSQADERLAALGEILGHIADDGRRDGRFPYATDVRAWDPDALLAAIEAADEPLAIAYARGALAAGMRLSDVFPTLAEAALSHYADFGHSVIYVVKSTELAELLGPSSDEALLCLLVRHFCYATREDLLPEFRAYARGLAQWQRTAFPNAGRPPILAGVSVSGALDRVVAWSAKYEPREIFRALVDSAAFVLSHVDDATLTTTSGSIAKNAGWLDHTHAITFAEAGERIARRLPELWPNVLLQIACFIGRSNACVDAEFAIEAWSPDDHVATLEALRRSLFDHGRERFIISVHLIKTLFAAEHLIERGDAEPRAMVTAVNRFFHAPIKGRHVIRTARQMLALVTNG